MLFIFSTPVLIRHLWQLQFFPAEVSNTCWSVRSMLNIIFHSCLFFQNYEKLDIYATENIYFTAQVSNARSSIIIEREWVLHSVCYSRGPWDYVLVWKNAKILYYKNVFFIWIGQALTDFTNIFTSQTYSRRKNKQTSFKSRSRGYRRRGWLQHRHLQL